MRKTMHWNTKKIPVYLFLSLLLFALALNAEMTEPSFLTRKEAPHTTGQYFLLSYARSGTNLISCYLQYFTSMPIKFLFDKSAFLSENRLNMKLDYSKPILYRTHFPQDLRKINKQENKLLYILRNPKECIYRHNFQKFAYVENFRDLFRDDDVIVREYMEGLEIFDTWESSLRFLVHYENLLTDPVGTLTQILQFFNESIPPTLTKEVLHTISQKTLNSYNKQHKEAGMDGSHSKGEDLLYHTKNMPLEILQDIDASLEKNYPVLWNNYLNRYQSRFSY